MPVVERITKLVEGRLYSPGEELSLERRPLSGIAPSVSPGDSYPNWMTPVFDTSGEAVTANSYRYINAMIAFVRDNGIPLSNRLMRKMMRAALDSYKSKYMDTSLFMGEVRNELGEKWGSFEWYPLGQINTLVWVPAEHRYQYDRLFGPDGELG